MKYARTSGRLIVPIVVLTILGGGLAAQPAWADPGESADEGYIMVQQALSYLVIDPGPDGSSQALVMLDDALAADDQDGVDVATLERAREALQAGEAGAARALLQDSITEAVTSLGPAVGEETGTTEVLPPLPPREALSPTDWVFLALSAFVAVVGVVLAVRFRPRQSLRELGRDIQAAEDSRGSSIPSTRKKA